MKLVSLPSWRFFTLIACVVGAAACGPVGSPQATGTATDGETSRPPATTGGPAADPASRALAELSLDERAGQLVMTKIDGQQLTEEDAEVLRRQHLGGVIVFGSNYADPQQMREFTRELQRAARSGNAAGAGLFVSVDQEGGFARHFMDQPPAQSSAELGRTATARRARAVALATGVALRELGINMNLAPVADLDLPPAHVMRGRSFGSDPRRVAQLVRATVDGLQAAGIIAVVKHFPGLGGATRNTDLGVARVDRDAAAIDEEDLRPFRAAIEAGVGAVMMSHAVYTDFGAELPASVGPDFVLPVLRGRLGYEGVVMTDSLNARGLREEFGDTVPRACAAAVENGVDIALVTGSLETATLCRRRIRDAVEEGQITRRQLDEAVLRVLRLKQQYGLLNP